MPLDYEARYRQQYADNVQDAPRAAYAGELDRKIDNFCSNFGFERNEVLRLIKSEPMFAAWFAKDPKKQNFYENNAAYFIEEIEGVENFIQLSTRELYVLGGGVFTNDQIRASGASTSAKSIDFRWNYNGTEYYASHKYTQESGGAQDNQFKDLKLFIKECNGTNKECYFVAIADGAYYQQQHNIRGTRTTKLDQLKQLTDRRKVYACTINELEALMLRLSS